MYPASTHVQKVFAELYKLLPSNERSKPQVLLLAGGVTECRNDTDREIIFRQESNFFYLTGCNVPGSLVLACSLPESSATTQLFIPKAELADIMWSIPPPSLEVAQQTHDVSSVLYPSELPSSINTILTNLAPNALFHTLPKDSPLFPTLPSTYTDVILNGLSQDDEIGGGITDAFLLQALHRARLTKTPHEISLIRQANAISSRSHETVMRVLGAAVKGQIKAAENAGIGKERPLLPSEWLIETEGEAEAIFVASCRREGSVHQAYPPIVAASTRASTLHYCCNDKAFAWGPVGATDHLNRGSLNKYNGAKDIDAQVLLIDAGCEHNNYASDITRTMPVGNSGKFTPEAKAIYSLVLEMQNAAFKLIKPGVHWDLVHLECHRILARGFTKLGIFKDTASEAELLDSGVTSPFFPHGLGHSLGMDVHDVPSASKPVVNDTIPKVDLDGKTIGSKSLYTYLRLRLPLEENMVVTNEPGCYFSPHLLSSIRSSPLINHDVLARYESIGGVRIEDVIVITAQGYENLTTVRSEVEWVEGVCSGEL
ncbi:prolidase [Coprinopsis sp. MPI-PUGE-AT-0042]|nr:prolidase [Coprinopsis sp. MPI-PUGE-AT-0042]